LDARTRKGPWESPSITGPAVIVNGALKSYGKVKALQGVDLEVKRGELYGLIGPNGAGKSTLMKALVGSVELDDGSVRVLGLNPRADKLSIKAHTGYVPESEVPPSFLKVREFLDFVMHVRGLEPEESTMTRWLAFFDLDEQTETIARNLSKGTRQKLMLSSAFIHAPPLLLLDEPFINLDPIYQRKVKDHLLDYVSKGGTVLISTHILSLAEELCSRVCIINKGMVLANAPTREVVKEHGNLEEAFLRMVGYYSK
jgi:ABC-2 type transport system ATP-binding protein